MSKISPRKDRRRLRTPFAVAAQNGNGQLQAILDTAVEGIIVIDDRGTIKTFNRAATKMFGYEPNEVLGKNVGILMPQPVRGKHDQYISRHLRTGIAKIIGVGREVVGLRKDGTTFPIDLAVGESHHHG
jgi:PAS domain S-box-containing protein